MGIDNLYRIVYIESKFLSEVIEMDISNTISAVKVSGSSSISVKKASEKNKWQVTGKGTSWQQLTSVSEEYRQKMFDNVKREFIKENGISNGDTTKRSDIFKDYQLSVSKDKRLSGTWTLEQYEGQYRAAMYAAVKSANPNWKPGQKFDTSILDNVTRESVESTLVKNGNRLVRNSIDVSV